jgi:hypothetical protein
VSPSLASGAARRCYNSGSRAQAQRHHLSRLV